MACCFCLGFSCSDKLSSSKQQKKSKYKDKAKPKNYEGVESNSACLPGIVNAVWLPQGMYSRTVKVKKVKIEY